MFYAGNNFIIRKWQKGDEPFLAHHGNNINIWEFLDDSFPSPYTYDDATVFIDDNLEIEIPINFAIVVDDEAVGNVGIINGLDRYKNSLQIEYWLSEEYWGQGVMTEVVGWLMPYCFDNYAYNSIVASVFSNNNASKKVLIKNGFNLEITIKGDVCKQNKVFDEFIFIKNRE